jgi:protein-S-isoprenylcysteine O-methyltransferase Ste14
MFPPIFPIYVRALAPLYGYAPLIWLSGVVCLWLTRYTHQLARRWGSAYYGLSAIVRPVGILLIGIGWLALYAPDTGYMPPGMPSYGWLPWGSWTDILCWSAIAAFSAFGLWAVAALGFRRSFLFRHVDDGLVTHGPYAIVRHPQFLSAIGITFFTTRLFNPAEFPTLASGAYYHSLDANWALFTVALWVLSVLEDRELAAHFGEKYREYAARVSGLLPN